MTLIGDYHLSLATALLGLANTLLLLVLIFGGTGMMTNIREVEG